MTVLEDSHSMLIRGGFVRQVTFFNFGCVHPSSASLTNSQKAHSGIFQFLPIGLRIQEKVEDLLDKHMKQIG